MKPGIRRARFPRPGASSCRRPTRMPPCATRASRSWTTTSWLLQLGWRDVFVVSNGLEGSLERGLPKGNPPPEVRLVSAAELSGQKSAVVVDFATSLQYRKEHIPAAAFAIRSRLGNHADALKGKPVVCTSPDGVLARYAAADLAALGIDAAALEG